MLPADLYESWADTAHNRKLKVLKRTQGSDAKPGDPLTRDNCSAGTEQEVDWRCPENPTHPIFRIPVSRRTHKNPLGCPECRLDTVRDGSFATKFPSQAAEWDSEKNADMVHTATRCDLRRV